MKTNTAKKITFSAIMIALSTILSMIKLFPLPLGGSVTLLAMLPVSLISVIFGVKFAIIPCFLYGALQMMLGNVFAWGLTPVILIGTICFDYLFAYGVMSLAGLFRKKGTLGIVSGIFTAAALRFVCHFISGFIFFANFEQFSLFNHIFESSPALYSLCYNGLYMLPEAILTCIGAFILCKIPIIAKLIGENTKV